MFDFRIKKRKTIYIHIGFMKTGTSAIQSFLKTNKIFLEKKGFYYPTINVEAMNHLGFSLLENIPSKIHHILPISRENLYEKLKNEIKKTKLNKIILTTEAYSLITTDSFLGEDAPKLLSEILGCENYEFKILTFIRRQDEYLESQYNQHIKTHNFWNLYTKDIHAFYEEKRELLNFNMVIERWSKYFGEKNLLVKVYDEKTNSVSDFLELLGIKEKPNINILDRTINQKLSFKALEFMRLANKSEIKKEEAIENYHLVELIESALGNVKSSYKLLTTEEASKVMEDCLEENTILSKKYLDNDITWCLPNKKYNRIDSNINKLTKEDCVKVATYIWNYFSNKK